MMVLKILLFLPFAAQTVQIFVTVISAYIQSKLVLVIEIHQLYQK